MEDILHRTYEKIVQTLQSDSGETVNYVKDIYASFTDEEVSRKIAELLTPPGIGTRIEIIFQSCEGLRKSCPNHTGDWYFTGDYPTPDGLRMLNRAFVEYYEKHCK